jgi:hypothetical protein
MRLNTASKYRHFVFIYIILILMLAFDVFVVSMEGSGTLGDTNMRLGYFVLAAFLFLIYRGNPVFTYDSDGEVIILDSKNPSLRPFGKMFNQHYEFPKRKLVGYSIDKMPLRRKLTMTLSSKDGKRKRVSATMSYLNKQEVKDLERSLRGILSKNKKAGHLEEDNHDA